MGEAIPLPSNDNEIARLKTNLKVWLIYHSEGFHAYMSQELKKCRNLYTHSFSLLGMSEEYLQNIDAPDLIFVEAGGNWSQKMAELQGYLWYPEEE